MRKIAQSTSTNTSRRSFLSTTIGSLLLPGLSSFKTSEAKGTDSFRILFQGDSITDGNRGRNDDPNHILGHGFVFSVASALGLKFPDRNIQFINRGVSGNRIEDLIGRWEQDTIMLNPDLVSILIGINDIVANIREQKTFDETEVAAAYRKLLEVTKNSRPQAMLVVGEPFVLPVGMVNENPDRWNELLASMQKIVKELAAEFGAVFIPYQSAFNDACKKADASYWIWDGIHPTYAGHGLMASLWIDEVRKRCRRIR